MFKTIDDKQNTIYYFQSLSQVLQNSQITFEEMEIFYF